MFSKSAIFFYEGAGPRIPLFSLISILPRTQGKMWPFHPENIYNIFVGVGVSVHNVNLHFAGLTFHLHGCMWFFQQRWMSHILTLVYNRNTWHNCESNRTTEPCGISENDYRYRLWLENRTERWKLRHSGGCA